MILSSTSLLAGGSGLTRSIFVPFSTEMGKARGCPIGCVVFRESVEVCVSRVLAREDHPTLKANDQESAGVVRGMARSFSFPIRSEGIGYCRVVDSLTDFEALAASLHLITTEGK
jgi:hypothetical protein